jgi:hypothetical protein
MFSFDEPLAPPPPLWHETSEIISTAKKSRAAQLNRFRIRNESRTNSGCKSTKRTRTKSDSGALFYFRRIFHRMDKNVNQLWNELEGLIRREPQKAVALAFGGGFFLCLLPLGRLLGILVRVLFVLFKPALLILGVVKFLEYTGFTGSANK